MGHPMAKKGIRKRGDRLIKFSKTSKSDSKNNTYEKSKQCSIERVIEPEKEFN